jgi:opacity protein-like surface antigen
VAGVCLGFLVLIGPAAAAEGPDAGQPAEAQDAGGDYWFRSPRGAFGVRGGWLFARAGSDIFDFVTDQLTLEKGDFNAPVFGVDLDVALTSRLDLVLGLESSFASTSSEYRDYVDNNRLPIVQETSLREMDLSAGVRVYLTERGRRISRFAWIPGTFAPYAGAGVGMMKYDFKQTGDFVDFEDLSVFSSTFQSEGWTVSGHAYGGLDVRVYRRVYVTAEGRYVWASSEMERDFVGFAPIDLAGFRLSGGVRFAF